MNYEEWISEVLQRLERSELAERSELCGCSTAEISEVEAHAGAQLPGSYRAFLASIGRGAGRFFGGTIVFYPQVLSLRSAAEALLLEPAANLTLPSNAFVCAMHEGYLFYWFPLTEDNDPPVYRYLEGDVRYAIESEKFTLFVEKRLREELNARQIRNGNY